MSLTVRRRPRPEEVAAAHARLAAISPYPLPAEHAVSDGWVPEPDPDVRRPGPPPPAPVPDVGVALRVPTLLERTGLPTNAGIGLVVVALLAVVVAGVLAWRARPHPVTTPAPAVLAPSAPSPGVVVSTGPVTEVVVDVAGRVRRPGLVTLPAGARVADALRAAGGERPGTDLTGLNLARRVVDGEQIVVGRAAQAAAPAGSDPAGVTATGPLDLNVATVADLDQLPGIGPVLAQRIVDWRSTNGGFRDVGQLRDVSGIGDARYAELQSLVRV